MKDAVQEIKLSNIDVDIVVGFLTLMVKEDKVKVTGFVGLNIAYKDDDNSITLHPGALKAADTLDNVCEVLARLSSQYLNFKFVYTFNGIKLVAYNGTSKDSLTGFYRGRTSKEDE